MGVENTLITTAFADLPAREYYQGVSLVRVPALRALALESSSTEIMSYMVSAFCRALDLIEQTSPDLIHAYFGVPSGAIAYVLNRLTGIPYLISFRGRDVHGGKSLDSNGISGPLRTISKIVWKKAEALVANSQGLKEIALRVDPTARVDVIANGIDTRRFTPGSTSYTGPLRILFAGRLEPYKGLSELIEALRLLRSLTEQTFVLKIAGDGSLRNALPQEARRAGVDDLIDFVGQVDKPAMPGLYQNADLFILPSLVEGMSNAILEAMASALPTLATTIPGSEELVCPNRTGLLVPPSDPQALARALKMLLENTAHLKKMGQQARKSAENRSWYRVAESYLNLYRQILA